MAGSMAAARAVVSALICGLFIAACGGAPPAASGPPEVPTEAPSGAAPTTMAPAPSADPGAPLDPSLSDAGVVARVAISNDQRSTSRNGPHEIIGVEEDASDCSLSFDGTKYSAVAWHDDAPDGDIFRFSVTVPADTIPDADGSSADISGRVSFDFMSQAGFGTLYTGDASDDDSGSAAVSVTRLGERLDFAFEGVTGDDVSFAGQLVCAPV